jgi:hypothetical protein
MWPRKPKGSPDLAVVKSRGKFAPIFWAESEIPDSPPTSRSPPIQIAGDEAAMANHV